MIKVYIVCEIYELYIRFVMIDLRKFSNISYLDVTLINQKFKDIQNPTTVTN